MHNHNRKDTLQRLALTLVANHIRLSVTPDLHAKAHQLLVRPGLHVENPSAIIVVVGAGASHDAARLPLGDNAAATLQDALKVPQPFLDRELDRLSIQYRLPKGDFETKLLALSRFGEIPLLDALSDLFRRRFYCASSYEILAHLLKHRFVDAIINFNFDELLDQAIDDEVGRQNCWMISSDGDLQSETFQSEMWDKKNRLRLPLYIKPHGTASHKSSMRFTREAYFLLPVAIANLLSECLTRTGHVTIVTLGFGMKSIEFTKLVESAAKKATIEVVAIDIAKDVLKQFPSTIARKVLLRPDSGGAGHLLEELWRKVEESVTDSTLLRDIDRHRLLSVLFTEPNPKACEPLHGRKLLSYLSDRVVIELAFAVAKAKGFVTIDQLEGSRVWQYLQQYLQTTGRHESIYTFAAKLGLRQTGYSRDSMRLEVPGQGEIQQTDLVIAQKDWPAAKQALCEKVIAGLSTRRKKIAQRKAGELEATLQKMFSGKEVEVCSPRNSRNKLLFKPRQEFQSLVGVQVYTKQLLKTPWDRLLCVAETGEWLLDKSVRAVLCEKPGRKIVVIVAFGAYKRKLIRSYARYSFLLKISG